MEEHNWCHDILILKLCRRCDLMMDITNFREGNHICRKCRNVRVKRWLEEDPTRIAIVRQRALLRARVKRLKTTPTENNDNTQPQGAEGNHDQLPGV